MNDMANEIKLLTGNSHPILARLVADRYDHHQAEPRRSRA